MTTQPTHRHDLPAIDPLIDALPITISDLGDEDYRIDRQVIVVNVNLTEPARRCAATRARVRAALDGPVHPLYDEAHMDVIAARELIDINELVAAMAERTTMADVAAALDVDEKAVYDRLRSPTPAERDAIESLRSRRFR